MIVPVVILAVRKCAVDVSPYVRKAAAAAIPKVFRLDATRQNELVEIIETMLRDSTPFVLSSAVAAFQEVCPTRVDLIHRHFRKICRMLVDMDEWGQILMANLLTRYARAQFKQPDAYDRELTASSVARGSGQVESPTLALALPGDGGKGLSQSPHSASLIAHTRLTFILFQSGAFEKQSANPVGTAGFYSDSESSDGSSDASDSDDDDDSDGDTKKKKTKPSKPKAPKQNASLAAAANAGGESYLDDDHRLLLRSSRPLLQSQNAGVVMAVGALHFYLSPVADLPKTLRALVFAMRCKPESQHIVLKNICTMVAVQPTLFETHFNAFFVHPADPLDVRGLKLEILTHVCTAENAPVLLRELQAYLRSSNDQFVALTIRAIGRCAAIMPQIATVCVRYVLRVSQIQAHCGGSITGDCLRNTHCPKD
jgi:AP-3 complex subunit beta